MGIDLKHNGKAKVDRSGSEERRISRAVDQGAGLVARVVVGGGQSPSGIAGVSRFRPLPEFGVAAKAPDYPFRSPYTLTSSSATNHGRTRATLRPLHSLWGTRRCTTCCWKSENSCLASANR